MIVELKTVVAQHLRNVPLKDILELLVYLTYIMDDDRSITICGALSDTVVWHCLHVKKIQHKLEVFGYVCELPCQRRGKFIKFFTMQNC